ncbi:MAG TPA: hypothetical protein VD993_13645 [Chitinophagaceae bacterium]|nr:hypothetical protein [Chitinophagaceae bacterium]
MKRLDFPSLRLFAVALIFFSSCGGDPTKDETISDSATRATTDTAAVAASSIVTTPQGMILVTHKVSNFQRFLAAYEAHDSFRLANGVHSYVIGRGFQDSNTVFVATRVDDMEKAKAFTKSPNLKKAMQEAGVSGPPAISFLTATWQDTAMLAGSTLRSKANFSVKDWTAWEKNFVNGRSNRIANGIVDRAYGHDPSDSTKVELVTAVTDTAKAFAYYKSNELKQSRAAGGVIGEPTRFLFYVVKRY